MKSHSVVLIAFFTSVFTAAGTAYLVARFHLSQEQKQVVIPSLVGLGEADARENLEASGLVMMIGGREPHAEAKRATVVRQSLPQGHRVAVGQPVSVTLAIAMPKVPGVAGRSVKEATRLLEAAGYTVQVGEAVPSDKHEKGQVVSQSPKAGSALEKKRTVFLRPSAGPAAVEVPKLTGLNLDKAKLEIEKAGLKVGPVNWVGLAETPSYLVMRQTPAAGEQAQAGATVTVVVNRGD